MKLDMYNAPEKRVYEKHYLTESKDSTIRKDE